MLIPAAFVKQSEIAAAVTKVERELAPDVVRIRQSIGTDWNGEPAIFFRIVLSDKASRPKRLASVAHRVTSRLADETRAAELGLFPYFSFRSESEQAELKEEAWA
jgi:hypothetical protein